MKKAFLLIFTFFLCCSASYGLSLGDLGTQITIDDGQANSTWGGGSSLTGEDNETEGNPNTYTYQSWDLEGIFWNSSTNKLFIIGGFDYLDGGPDPYSDVNMGDIFIGDNYVLDLSRKEDGHLQESDGKYDIIQGYENFEDPTDVTASTPYAYLSGGTSLGSGSYLAYKISDSDWAGIDLFNPWRETAYGEWSNDTHYALEIDIIGDAAELINEGSLIHATLACGNDAIKGKINPVPEPAAMLLLGSGLICLAGFGRKRFLK